jgi:hypothetical protein
MFGLVSISFITYFLSIIYIFRFKFNLGTLLDCLIIIDLLKLKDIRSFYSDFMLRLWLYMNYTFKNDQVC